MNAPSPAPPAVRTTCPYCGVGCGVLAKPDGRGGADDRRRSRRIRRISAGCARRARRSARRWGSTAGCCIRCCASRTARSRASAGTTALDHVADGFRRIIERDGPDAVAFYLSGQLLTEDYYVANKLMKGFIGSRQCRHQFAAVHGVVGRRPSPRLRRRHRARHLRGSRPGRPDRAGRLERRLVPSGAVPAHGREQARARRARSSSSIRAAPRPPRRPTCSSPIAPGMDTALFCGLLVHLADTGALDYGYIDAHTDGFAAALARAREIAPDVARRPPPRPASPKPTSRASSSCSARRERVVTCFSQGVNQSAQGTDKVNAIINCHLATGRIGKPGMGPFSLTGQPNAMGGREVGGLANQLAAHMGLRAGRDRPRAAASGTRRAWRRAKASRPSQMFEADRARRDQGAVGDGDQSGGVAAARRRRARRR